MASALQKSTDMTEISDDIAALRRDFSNLLSHLRTGPINNARAAAQGAAEHFSGRAADVYGQASSQAGRMYDQASSRAGKGAEAVAERVEQSPLTTLLMAFSVGFVASWWLSR